MNRKYRYRVDCGSGGADGIINAPSNASKEEIALAILNDLYDYEIEEVLYEKVENIRISKVMMRMGNTIRLAVKNLPEDILEDINDFMKKKGYKPGDGYIPGGGIKDMTFEVFAGLNENYVSLIYCFDEYEVIAQYSMYDDFCVMIKDFIENYEDEIPDNHNLLLGADSYLKNKDVIKINNKLARY